MTFSPRPPPSAPIPADEAGGWVAGRGASPEGQVPTRGRRLIVVLAGMISLAHLVGLDLGLRWLGAQGETPAAAVTLMTLAFDQELTMQAPPVVAPRAVDTAPAPPAPGVMQAVTLAAEPPEPEHLAQAEAAAPAEPPPVETERPAPLGSGEAPGAADEAPAQEPPARPEEAPSVSEPAAEPSPPAVTPRPAPAFEWPPSTRLSYRLQGDYRGPVNGVAKVEWLHGPQGYQVMLEIKVGPEFAPFLQRRMISEGQVSARGLSPRRYVEETKVLAGAWRRVGVEFEGPTVLLGQGERLPAEPGLQDTASQFVHLTWLFTTQPERLTPGESVVLPVALRNKIDRWSYDILELSELKLPWGPVPAWHLKPRRESRTSSGLSMEIWFAPSLQYLPVRILIRQDEQTYIDLTLERLPQQALSP